MKQLLTIVSISIIITVFLLTGLLWIVRTVGAADEITWNEYQELISMYNYEISKMGGAVTLQNISGENGIVKAVHAKIRGRVVEVGDGRIRGEQMSSNEYSAKRESLMQKYENSL